MECPVCCSEVLEDNMVIHLAMEHDLVIICGCEGFQTDKTGHWIPEPPTLDEWSDHLIQNHGHKWIAKEAALAAMGKSC